MRDEDVRASCFGQLAILWAQSGDDVPYRGGLDRGFAFRGRRVPYLSPQKGIFRAAVQRGPAALSIQTSAKSPYRDVETPDGFLYDYRATFQWSARFPLLAFDVDRDRLDSASAQACLMLAEGQQPLRIDVREAVE